MKPGFRTMTWLVVALCLLSAMAVAAEAEPKLQKRAVVLDTTSPWRSFNVLAPPVIRSDSGLITVKHGQRWLNWRTDDPASAWRTVDFDDSLWTRGTAVTFSRTPYLARLCLRARFTVTDPGKVDGLTLALGYSGGAIVTVNGREISRTHLPKDVGHRDALAEDYPSDVFVDGKGKLVPGEWRNRPMARKPGDPIRRRVRDVSGVVVPRSLLRKGINVLAIEVVRSPYDKALSKKGGTEKGRAGYDLNWSTCQVYHVQLTAGKADGLLLEVTRPAGLRVWNNDVLTSDFDFNFGTSSEPLRPIRIVGARGGAFSGKVVAGSRGPLRGLVAEVSAFRGPSSAAIPASAVSIRYGRPWGNEISALDERPPEEVLFEPRKPGRYALKTPNMPAKVAGAVLPVWVTIDVPRDARPGKYTAVLTISAKGEQPVRVPVELTVADWTVPEPKAFRTWAELWQVPDSVAIEYKSDLWSERHFQLIEKSMSFLGKVGTRTVYLPLISETNQGNAESMVRWIPKDDGTYDYDFSPLERYLDAAEKHLGKPEIVCLWVWDVYINANAKAAKGGKGGDARALAYLKKKGARLGEGPLVTALDPKTRKTRTVELPLFTDPKSGDLWRPMLKELHGRLKRRGLDKAVAFGCMSDAWPAKVEVAFFNEMIPGTPWVSHSHHGVLGRGPLNVRGLAACVYQTRVWHISFTSSLVKRMFGWKTSGLVAEYNRSKILHLMPPTKWRHLCELNITGGQRGIGRIGADNWKVVRDKRDKRVGYAWSRYPQSSWRNLDLYTNLLAPGVDGPVATVRYEMFREGIQECEARIVIEEALADPKKLEALGDALATECQKALDDHALAMWTSQSNLQLTGPIYRYATTWRTRSGTAGNRWFIHSRWQGRTLGLFHLAGKVERTLKSG